MGKERKEKKRQTDRGGRRSLTLRLCVESVRARERSFLLAIGRIVCFSSIYCSQICINLKEHQSQNF